MSTQSPRPPRAFYRAHHKDSFTYYDPNDGFQSQVTYCMDYCHWINKAKIDSHLDWSARPLQSTPFISVFDNEDAATRRAVFFRNNSYKDIVVAKIQPSNLERTILSIRFANEVVNLPTWSDPDGTLFLATVDLRRHLRINLATNDEHEWLVVEWIPPSMIRKTIKVPSLDRILPEQSRYSRWREEGARSA